MLDNIIDWFEQREGNNGFEIVIIVLLVVAAFVVGGGIFYGLATTPAGRGF